PADTTGHTQILQVNESVQGWVRKYFLSYIRFFFSRFNFISSFFLHLSSSIYEALIYLGSSPLPPMILVSSSSLSTGNGGDDRGFEAMDSTLIRLSFSVISTDVISPQSLHRWMISKLSSPFTHMPTGSSIPPHTSPSAAVSWIPERQAGQ